jgi:hypothetical protein
LPSESRSVCNGKPSLAGNGISQYLGEVVTTIRQFKKHGGEPFLRPATMHGAFAVTAHVLCLFLAW